MLFLMEDCKDSGTQMFGTQRVWLLHNVMVDAPGVDLLWGNLTNQTMDNNPSNVCHLRSSRMFHAGCVNVDDQEQTSALLLRF